MLNLRMLNERPQNFAMPELSCRGLAKGSKINTLLRAITLSLAEGPRAATDAIRCREAVKTEHLAGLGGIGYFHARDDKRPVSVGLGEAWITTSSIPFDSG